MAGRVAFEHEESPANTHASSSKVCTFTPNAPSATEKREAPGRDRIPAATTNAGAKPVDSFPSTRYKRFYEVFGILGVPMMVSFVTAASVSFAFAAMQIFPLDAMNLLMGTSDLDYGHFWIPAETSTPIQWLAATALALFGVGYIWLILFMVAFRSTGLLRSPQETNGDAIVTVKSAPETTPRWSSQTNLLSKQVSRGKRLERNKIVAADTAAQVQAITSQSPSPDASGTGGNHSNWRLLCKTKRREFTSLTGMYHHYYIAVFDLPKLLFHSLNLKDFLAQGFPLPIISFYAALLLANWLIALYRFQKRTIDRKCLVTRMSLLFDLFFAVFAPFFVFAYAYFNFHLDRKLFQVREETLTAGTFGRVARLFADPIELTVFSLGFQNLQLLTFERVGIKCFLNVLGLLKWNQIIAHLVRVDSDDRNRTASTVLPKFRHHSRRNVCVVVAVFVLGVSGTFVGISQSIRSSIENCKPYPQCGLISYRWRWNTDHLCPCIAYIDHDNRTPTVFSEWMNPPDSTAALAAVARAGVLGTVQIINRKLVEIPEDLRVCENLRYLILVYTQTKRLPDWAKRFTNLQYFHVEVNVVTSDLEALPLDLFSRMPNLRFVRIGRAAKLQQLPSFAGLTKLSTLILSGMYELRELPPFDDLTKVSALYFVDLTHVRTLPSMRNVRSLQSFSLSRRAEMCCNGFITGKCDLTDFQCRPRSGEPAVVCVPDRIPAFDLAWISRAKGLVCSKNLTVDLPETNPTLASSDAACGGVLYRECYVGNRRGICYNTRMQLVTCDFMGEYENMRRLEIARGVGDKCDPRIEAWLGCDSDA